MTCIYLSARWSNALQPATAHALRAAGHVVYDIRYPFDELPGLDLTGVPKYAKLKALHPIFPRRNEDADTLARAWAQVYVHMVEPGVTTSKAQGRQALERGQRLIYLNPSAGRAPRMGEQVETIEALLKLLEE